MPTGKPYRLPCFGEAASFPDGRVILRFISGGLWLYPSWQPLDWDTLSYQRPRGRCFDELARKHNLTYTRVQFYDLTGCNHYWSNNFPAKF